MIWQFSPVWWKVWKWRPWHISELDTSYPTPFYSHFAGIGPLQFHWYSFGPDWRD